MDSNTAQEVYTLRWWIGKEVWACIPLLNPNGGAFVTIRNVEAGGVWIEAPDLTIGLVRGKTEPDELDGEGKVIAFVPYSQIVFVATLDRKTAHRARIVPFGTNSATPPIDE